MKLLAALLAVCSITGCGKKESAGDQPSSGEVVAAEATGTTPAAKPNDTEPPADDRCEVTVEGDIKDQGFGRGGPSAAGTDYWMSEEELRKGLEVMAGAFGDKKRDIDADMKADPRIYTLILNCQTPRTKISFLPAGGTKYADVPFGPKKYKIVASSSDAAPGAMQTLVTFEKDKGVWGVDGVGELDVVKFDKTGIAGTFAYNMIERQFGTPTAPPRKAKITGKFAFKCSLGTSVCRDGAK
ncbi:MAG: hypothetical protein H0T46_36065 [Deltaproteobacteria bacterium]|nr:hypothetical protein [Deltaproteobacteria bacterium]